MIIGNAKVYLDGEFRHASVTVEADKITAIGKPVASCNVDAQGKYLVPGFIDLHTHGAMNKDISDGNPRGTEVSLRTVW